MSFSKQLSVAGETLSSKDATMAKLVKQYGVCQIMPHDDYFGELLDSIISQQLSVKAASTIKERVLKNFYGKTPTPQDFLNCDIEVIRGCGVSYQKISYIRDLSSHIKRGTLDLHNFNRLSNQQIVEQLTAVRGLGVWSAHMFMIFSLGRLDVLPVGDLGIKKAAMLAYGLPNLPKPDELEELSINNGWEPYQSVASWYLWQSLNNT